MMKFEHVELAWLLMRPSESCIFGIVAEKGVAPDGCGYGEIDVLLHVVIAGSGLDW